LQSQNIIDQYHDALQAEYGAQLLPGHLRAIDAIGRCRTPAAGELFVQCPGCGHATWKPHSCGHRSCPQCQNHEASLWLDRQQANPLPVKWVVDCTHAGNGQPALKYLSRYLYRGVISENNIVSNQDGNVTFKYVDSRTGKIDYRTVKGEDFLWLVLQYVLP
jgi:hypothetical protein